MGPGYYDHDKAQMSTLTKSRTAVIKLENKSYVKPPEQTPEADDKHYKPFGAGLNKIDFGKKYEFKVDSNPHVGKYDVNTASKLTKPASKAAKIMMPTSSYKRPVENSPEPGTYDAHLKSFGSEAKSFNFKGKPQENYDPNLGPGYYQADAALDKIANKTASVLIRENTFK